jgi:hypothetical protein
MPATRLTLGTITLFLIILAPPPAPAQPEPAARFELHAAEDQWSRLIGLFSRSPYPDGAAALAAWKAGEPRSGDRNLGKAAEALIASLNPQMARECRSLEGARLLAWPTPLAWRWSIAFPSDDGIIRDLLFAQALTEGAQEPPIGDWAVDRLGPPGSLLAASGPAGPSIAVDRDTLALGLALPGHQPTDPPPGVTWELNPVAFNDQAALRDRQLAEALLGLGATRLRGHLRVEEDGLAASSRVETGSPLRRPAPVDPSWLDWIDAEAVAALSLALDPDRSSWDALFRSADRAQKVDPANKDLAPLRLRLNLLASAAGLRPEREVYPRLAGLTASLLRPPGAGPLIGLVVLHCTGEPEARAIADETLPRLLRRWLGEPVAGSWSSPDLGPIQVARHGPLVVVAAGLEPKLPRLNMRTYLESFWTNSPPDRLGFALPSLLAARAGSSPRAAEALAKAPPVVWWGTTSPGELRDEVRWSGLSTPLADFLRAEIGPGEERQP